MFRQLVVYLAPVLPGLARQVGVLLNRPIERWDEAQTPLVGTKVNRFEHLMKRVEPAQVEAMINSSREEAPASKEAASTAGATSPSTTRTTTSALPIDGPEPLAAEPLAPTISFDEFSKVDLRVARVVAAQEVMKSKKLLQLTLSLGGEERRNVFAGIKEAYTPDQLIGRLVIIAANLEPRKMTFGMSEGMVVAAGPGGSEVFVLSPDSGATRPANSLSAANK